MKRMPVTASRNYDVLIGPDLLDRAGAELRQVLPDAPAAAVAADETVFALYGARLTASLEKAGFRTISFAFPAGEASKNLTTYAALLDFLGRSGLTRSDVLVALGGGVTGDLAGFAAATYQRGMAFCQVPAALADNYLASVSVPCMAMLREVDKALPSPLYPLGAAAVLAVVYVASAALGHLAQRCFDLLAAFGEKNLSKQKLRNLLCKVSFSK